MVLGEPWELPQAELVDRADLLWEVVWPNPQRGRRPPVDALASPSLRQTAEKLVEAGLFETALPSSAEARMSAGRVRVLGSYAYDVVIAYGNQQLPLFVAGPDCQIIPRSALPRANRLRFLSRPFKRFFRWIVTDEVAGVSKNYARSVALGRAHLSNYRGLIPAVGDALKCTTEVTAAGYQMYVVDRLAGEVPLPVRLELDIDVDADGEQILRATHALGPAHRDKFPLALKLSHRLSVGRLAVIDDAQGERFALVDCRPYASLHVEGYAIILKHLAAEARRLQSSVLE